MEINNQNNIPFKTKIKIVSPSRFRYCIDEALSSEKIDCISSYIIYPKSKNIKYNAFKTNVQNIYTKHIRSCTGVLVANKKENASLFGHFYNSKENIDRLNLLDSDLNGSNAILVGSKREFLDSREVFKALKKKINAKKIPVSLFEKLKLEWEANMAYFSNDDKLLLCVKKAEDPREYVRNMSDLKKVFGKVKISSSDTIEFCTKPKPTLRDKFQSWINEVFK